MGEVRWREPNPENLARIDRAYALGRRAALAALSPWLRIEANGATEVPATGPALVLANHATLADPITLMLAAGRPIQWLGTETLLRTPGIGAVQRWMGTVPKKRFHTDVRAVWLLRQWALAGGVVGLFPEGERTWTGPLGPLLPGLGRLVRLLDVPVVIARVDNHYRQWPRWTSRPRRGRIAVTFARRTFPPDVSAAAIEAEVARALTTDPRGRIDLPIRGRGLARGLANVVFACPRCDAEPLAERADRLGCTACGATWTVDGAHRLVPGDGGPTLLLEAEAARLQARDIARWQARTGSAEVVLRSDPVTLEDHTTTPRALAHGPLTLFPDRLTVGDQTVPLGAITTANVEFQRALEIRTADRYLKATIPTGSAWRWPWAIRWWADQRA